MNEIRPVNRSSRARAIAQLTMQLTGITLLLVAAFVGHARWQTGSMDLVWPYLAGQRLFLLPPTIELGETPVGTLALEQVVRVKNAGSKAVQLTGARTSCGCLELDTFPIDVPPGKEANLTLRVGLPQHAMPYDYSVKLFFNVESGPTSTVTLKITGTAS